jgi:Protein of unknown function (DUF4240)
MTMTTFRVNIQDVDLQLFQELQSKAGPATQVEIRIEESSHGEGLFSSAQFWALIDLFDWKQKKRTAIIQPTVEALAKLPVSNIYLFHDTLSEKLYHLDTRRHAGVYTAQQDDGYLSVDDFLYVRCGVVAEGEQYYQHILVVHK